MTRAALAGLRVRMAVYGDITYDSRVRREAATLGRAGADVTLVCLANDGGVDDLPDSVRVVTVAPTVTSVVPRSWNPFHDRRRRNPFARVVDRLRWLAGYVANVRSWGRRVAAGAGDVDVWHLHDLPALAGIAPHVSADARIVYDAHELFLEAGTARLLPGLFRRVLGRYERRLVRRTALVVTVNEALAAELARRYHPRRVVVTYNAPPLQDEPTARADSPLRTATGLEAGAHVILYHGNITTGRGVEPLLDALASAPALADAHLVLLGFGGMREVYADRARDLGIGPRFHLLDPVAPSELLRWVAGADVGAMPIQPSTLNHVLSTPNKLFECLAAGVPVVASDYAAVAEIVRDDPAGPLGVLCDPRSVDDVARACAGVLDLDAEASQSLRARCRRAAAERWNWDRQAAALVTAYQRVVAPG